jgi:hypothetical protein
MRRRNAAWAAAVVLAVGFLAGVYVLFNLRFESGSAWPLFSTFRPDPLGAKALYESIALQPRLTVQRNMRPLMNLHGRGTTLFLLGVEAREFALQEDFPELERMAGEGGRLVIAFVPAWPSRRTVAETAPPKNAPQPPLQQHLGVSLHRETSEEESHLVFDELPRHTALWFGNLAREWSVVRTWHGHPVMIERAWKRGSVVLVADSWMLSNDALARQPDATTLAWLAGPNTNIVFDEHHLGVEESGSVAGLMRRYRLMGVVGALLVLAALFIWKNASSFPPRAPAAATNAPGLRGYSAAEGLVCLLERSIPAKELARVCAEEYQGKRVAGGAHPAQLEDALRAAARDVDPVRAYAGVRRTMEEMRHPWKQNSNG